MQHIGFWCVVCESEGPQDFHKEWPSRALQTLDMFISIITIIIIIISHHHYYYHDYHFT